MKLRWRQTLVVAEWELVRSFRWTHVLVAVLVFAAGLPLDGRLERVRVAVLALLATGLGTLCFVSGAQAERRQRVAEFIAAAIPRPAWLDGKQLGTSAYALGWVALPGLVEPSSLPALLLWSLLGLLVAGRIVAWRLNAAWRPAS